MRQTGHIGWTVAVAAALFVAACGGKEKPQETTADTAAPAAQAESPAGSTQAAAPAPTSQRPPASKPAAAKPKPAPSGTSGGQTGGTTPSGQAGPSGGTEKPAATPTVALTVETGTTVMTTLDRELSTKDAKVGDAFTATVSQPVSADGRTALPAGATIHGAVTAVQKSGSSGQPAVIKIDFQRVTVDGKDFPISADLIDAQPQKKSRTGAGEAAVKIGAGTAAGAILGRIIGGNKTGTFIGAAVGAAAGTAIVLGTQDVDAVLPEGSPMTLKLTGPLTVRRPQ